MLNCKAQALTAVGISPTNWSKTLKKSFFGAVGNRVRRGALATTLKISREPASVKGRASKPVLEGPFGSPPSHRLSLLCAVPWKPFPLVAGTLVGRGVADLAICEAA